MPRPTRPRLSPSQARRVALAAQGFADPPPAGRIDIRHLRRVLGRIQLVQIDSVAAVVRAHYLPLYSRLGPYPPALLDDAAYRRRELFEYWAHEASLLPVSLQPLFRHRMRSFEYGPTTRGLAGAPAGFLDAVEAEIAARGPLTAAELSDGGDRRGPWWGWSAGKAACEALFARGRLAVADRRGFARVYDLAERVLPPAVLAEPTPPEEEAARDLLARAADAHGVATAADLADYFRLPVASSRQRLAELVAAGRLEEVAVDGWSEPAYLAPAARRPRRVHARALLAPFDPVVWSRRRAERLFGFHYRIEIYTPAPRRRYGYYVLPFLLGERLVARVDVRADRPAGRLRVPGAFAEGAGGEDAAGGEGGDRVAVTRALAAELVRLAEWLGLGDVEVGDRGDLSAPLRARL